MKALLIIFLLLYMFASNAHARIHSVISVDQCAWRATHIVVVTEGDSIDGQVNVLQSLLGHLNPGEALFISELKKFKTAKSRRIDHEIGSEYLFTKRETGSALVSGSEIVLFLRRNANSSRSGRWVAIGAVWIEQQKAYGLWDGDSAWDGVIGPLGSKAGILGLIFETLHQRNELARILRIKVETERAAALQPFKDSTIRFAKTIASAELEFLDRTSKQSPAPRLSNQVATALEACQPDCTIPMFLVLLERELAFWKANAPDLKPGWWNDQTLSRDELYIYRNHFSITLEALRELQRIELSENRSVVEGLRMYWLSLPQLRDMDEVVKACDEVLNPL